METAVRFLKVQSWFIEKLLKKGKAKKIFEKGGHKIWLLLGRPPRNCVSFFKLVSVVCLIWKVSRKLLQYEQPRFG